MVEVGDRPGDVERARQHERLAGVGDLDGDDLLEALLGDAGRPTQTRPTGRRAAWNSSWLGLWFGAVPRIVDRHPELRQEASRSDEP